MKKVNFIKHLWTTASDHCTWFTSLLIRLFRFQRKTGGIQPSSLSWEQNVSEVLRIIISAYKSIDWFPYEGNTGIYWVKWFKIYNKTRANQIQSIKKNNFFIIKLLFPRVEKLSHSISNNLLIGPRFQLNMSLPNL